MKNRIEWIFLIILILFFTILIVWNFMNPNRKESFESGGSNLDLEETDLDTEKPEDGVDSDTEFHEVSQNTTKQLGNFLSCYFYNMGLAFLHGKNFQTKIEPNGDMFTNYFPELVYFDQNIQDAFISVGISDVSLEKEWSKFDNHCMSTWIVITKERETFWTIMKPTVNRIIKKALEKAGLDRTIDAPAIHYRCSDMPFGKMKYYHFQKYSFFKDSLDMIQQKTKNKYNKVYICYCNSHNSVKENQDSCDKYSKSLTDYLESLDYTVITKCQSVNEDFATMFYAPGLISTSSSFSFFAGYFSDNVFISSIYDENTERQCDECGDWLQKGYTLKHSEVEDYHDTDNVISMINDQ